MRITILLLIVALAGCASQPPAASPTPTAASVTTTDAPPQPRPFPDPPAELTAETARETVLEYEAAYVEHELADSAADDFSAYSGGAGFPDARIVNETESGYVVQVKMPYSFQEGSGEGDTFTRARYLVTTETIRRINGSDVAGSALRPPGRS